MKKRIALVGGGPSALFLLRRFVEKKEQNIVLDIFEKKARFGAGMPYSSEGSGQEHITNVSGNEIPRLDEALTDWVRSLPDTVLSDFHIDARRFDEYCVLPRLLFGEYLRHHFDLAVAKASGLGWQVNLFSDCRVKDILYSRDDNQVEVVTGTERSGRYDAVIVCSGHHWPLSGEGRKPHYFDSPYPPKKLESLVNMPIHIKGSSLTAIDAVRTLARSNGYFTRGEGGETRFVVRPGCDEFQISLFSRHAMLPGMRFHLNDPSLSRRSLLSKDQIERHRSENDGFVSLDFLFEHNFKNRFRDYDAEFYRQIKDLSLEDFVTAAMKTFEGDPFEVFAEEYRASLRSIRKHRSEYWREKLAILSIAMNYPAKYFSAEDTLRLREHLMPLVSLVIAFVPQSSAEEILALHAAGRLTLTDSDERNWEKGASAFIDCTGQPRLRRQDFPFQGLVRTGVLGQARVRYRSRDEWMDVPGVAITDAYKAVSEDGSSNAPVYIMAVPYIGGFNPDYSGLDFCEEASKLIVDDLGNNGLFGHDFASAS